MLHFKGVWMEFGTYREYHEGAKYLRYPFFPLKSLLLAGLHHNVIIHGKLVMVIPYVIIHRK